jgi:cyclic pyranopterin phosphate synthase
MLDSFNREINYLRLSFTDLCNLRCKYCMPNGIEKCSHDQLLRLESLALIVKALTRLGLKKVRITGGEPLFRRGVVSLVEQISPLVKNVSLTTNGTLLAHFASDLKLAGLSAINISIDTLDQSIYNALTLGGDVKDAINGIEEANRLGFKLKINTVLQKDVNENELPSLAKFAKDNNAILRFIELMPFESTQSYFDEHYIPATDIIKKYDLKFLEYQNNCAYYDYEGMKIGFITPISNKFCHNCNRIRITAKGMLILCLHCQKEYDLKPYLDDENELVSYLAKCIIKKPKQHNLAGGERQKSMFDIGG